MPKSRITKYSQAGAVVGAVLAATFAVAAVIPIANDMMEANKGCVRNPGFTDMQRSVVQSVLYQFAPIIWLSETCGYGYKPR